MAGGNKNTVRMEACMFRYFILLADEKIGMSLLHFKLSL